jgi:hypothetical protein
MMVADASSPAHPVPLSSSSDADSVLVELREHLTQPGDIRIQDPNEEFFSNHVEDRCQFSRYMFSLCRGLDDRNPPVTSVDIARQQTTRLKPIDKPSDFTLVSPESNGELPWLDFSGFHAAKKHARFLDGHPES